MQMNLYFKTQINWHPRSLQDNTSGKRLTQIYDIDCEKMCVLVEKMGTIWIIQ